MVPCLNHSKLQFLSTTLCVKVFIDPTLALSYCDEIADIVHTIISDSDSQFSNPDTLYSDLEDASIEDIIECHSFVSVVIQTTTPLFMH